MSHADPFPLVLLVSAGLHAVLLCVTAASRPPQVSIAPGIISVELVETPKTSPQEPPSTIASEAPEPPLPRPEAPPQATVIPGVDVEAQPDALRNPAPVYPSVALRNGWEGEVIVRVEVGMDGKPLQTLVSRSSGYRVLDEAAVHAVTGWTFLPGTTGGRPVTSWVEIPIRFQLEKP